MSPSLGFALTTLLLCIGSVYSAASDELFWAYNRSPAVLAPNATGGGAWTEAYEKAREIASQLTLEQKAALTLGSSTTNGCSGFVDSIPGVNFTGLCLQDAESGVRTAKLVSAYPAQIHVGASWNRDLALQRARYIGREHRAKGVNVALGPVVGPLGRVAKGGRNWEGFSNDPYLAGALVYPTVLGFQESVVACVKHLIANEQEANRQAFLLGFLPTIFNQSVSSNVDDRTMHELYLWPFYDALKAEPGSVMCSYNRVNGSHACQNSKVMNGLLKTELGFQGFVVSDWFGTHTGIAANTAGLDMVMPNSPFLSKSSLANAVRNGSFPESRLQDQVTRILAAWYRYARLERPGLSNFASVDARDPASAATRFQSAVEGHVLVKNVNNALPLRRPTSLSLFGYDAIGGKNSSSDPLFDYGAANTQRYENGWFYTIIDMLIGSVGIGNPSQPRIPPQIALDGTMITGVGSGATTPASSISPYDAFLQQATADKTTLYTDFQSQTPTVRNRAGPCVVFINAQSMEAYDRSELQNEYSDNLVTNVANNCANTIVVLHHAGIRLVDRWIDHANITAVIYGHLPGQDSGNSLVEIMYGRQSPSGRLPYTVARKEADYGALLEPDTDTPGSRFYSQSNFDEGLLIDYKHFIAQGIQPRFAFGYGLTYSDFRYSKFEAHWNVGSDLQPLPPAYATTPVPQGGHAALYDIVATASVHVANIGRVPAAEVAQLYVGIPGSGVPKVLRGFEKILLQPNTEGVCTFELRRRDLSIWDVTAQQWVLNRGTYTVMVGKSVVDIVDTVEIML